MRGAVAYGLLFVLAAVISVGAAALVISTVGYILHEELIELPWLLWLTSAVVFAVCARLILQEIASRAYDELRVCPGRIERTRGETVEAFRYADLSYVGLMEGRVWLLTLDGRALLVHDPVVAPALAKTLAEFAFPDMSQRYLSELAEGRNVTFREPAARHIARSFCLYLLLTPMLLLFNSYLNRSGELHPVTVTLAIVLGCALVAHAGATVFNGGAVMSASGIRRRRDSADREMSWPTIVGVSVTPLCLRVESAHQAVSISHAAANAVPIARVIRHFRPDLFAGTPEAAP